MHIRSPPIRLNHHMTPTDRPEPAQAFGDRGEEELRERGRSLRGARRDRRAHGFLPGRWVPASTFAARCPGKGAASPPEACVHHCRRHRAECILRTWRRPHPRNLGRKPPTWHVLSREGAVRELHVEPERGLTSEEAAERLARYGPNRFAEAKTEPRWHAFLRQYQDPMQIVLLVAGIISIYPVKQPGTGHRDPAADAAQRGARPQPGGQGRGGRRRAGEDDDRQGARAPRRRARAAAGRAARARRRRRRSRPATSSPPTGACWRRRRWRSPRRR